MRSSAIGHLARRILAGRLDPAPQTLEPRPITDPTDRRRILHDEPRHEIGAGGGHLERHGAAERVADEEVDRATRGLGGFDDVGGEVAHRHQPVDRRAVPVAAQVDGHHAASPAPRAPGPTRHHVRCQPVTPWTSSAVGASAASAGRGHSWVASSTIR